MKPDSHTGILWRVARHLLVLRAVSGAWWAHRRHGATPHPASVAAADKLADALGKVGGAYLKAGQLTCTRADLLPDEVRQSFRPLCDVNAATVWEVEHARQTVRDRLDVHVDHVTGPVGVGSVALVFRAIHARTGDPVAVKVRRPTARSRFTDDLWVGSQVARCLSRLPGLGVMPVVDGFDRLADTVRSQLLFDREARYHQLFRDALTGRTDVYVPALVPDLCDADELVIEYIDDAVRIDDVRLPEPVRRQALTTTVRVLFEMLFIHGVVHADLHPGNLLVTPEGQLVLLDFGLCEQVEADHRDALADLFLAVYMGDTDLTVQALLRNAEHVPDSLRVDMLTRELEPTITDYSTRRASDFHVAQLVHALYQAQHAHGMRGSAGLAVSLAAILAVEGAVKDHVPGLDIQREALVYALNTY